jgi:hypothetical protein
LDTVSKDISGFFRPNQLGVGTPNGGEAIVHAVAAAMENLGDEDCILQVEFSKAFNQIFCSRFSHLNH